LFFPEEGAEGWDTRENVIVSGMVVLSARFADQVEFDALYDLKYGPT
jgi:hypothetical protein